MDLGVARHLCRESRVENAPVNPSSGGAICVSLAGRGTGVACSLLAGLVAWFPHAETVAMTPRRPASLIALTLVRLANPHPHAGVF